MKRSYMKASITTVNGCRRSWSATRGATLYVGTDNALYACERRPIDELFDGDGLAQCVDDFGETVADWQERSALYA